MPLRECLNPREPWSPLIGDCAAFVISTYVVVKDTLGNPESLSDPGGRYSLMGFVPNATYPNGNTEGVPSALRRLRGADTAGDGG